MRAANARRPAASGTEKSWRWWSAQGGGRV